MNLMLKDIKFRKVHFILASLGLGLLLSIVVAMGGIEGGMIRDATVFADSTGANVWVSQKNSGGPFAGQSELARSLVENVSAVLGVEQASPFVFGSYTIPKPDGFVRVFIVGTEENGLGRPTSLIEGRFYDTGEQEVVVDKALGLALGDRITLGADEYEVVGLTQGMNFQRVPLIYVAIDQTQAIVFSRQSYMNMTAESQSKFSAVLTRSEGSDITAGMESMLPESIEKTGFINAVLVKVENGYVSEAVANELEQKLNLDARTHQEELNLILSGEVKRGHDQMLMFKTILMGVSGVVVMLISYANTIENTRDIAILKVLGTPNSRIVGMIVQEAVLIGVVGAVAGSVLINLMAPRFPMPLSFRTEDIVWAFAGAFAFCSLGSLLAVRKALSIDPMAAMGR